MQGFSPSSLSHPCSLPLQSYDKLQNNVAAFAELLNEELPALPEEDTTTRIAVSDNIQSSKVSCPFSSRVAL
jgi:hypothetical protein